MPLGKRITSYFLLLVYLLVLAHQGIPHTHAALGLRCDAPPNMTIHISMMVMQPPTTNVTSMVEYFTF